MIQLAIVIFFVWTIGGLLVSPAAADDHPEIDGGEKINDTTMEIWLVDDTGIDIDSVTASEFFLSDGELAGIDVFEDGSNATVELYLAEPVDTDEIVVGVSSNTGIQDVDGSHLNVSARDTVAIEGMDSVEPTVTRDDIPAHANESLSFSYLFSERLSDIRVRIRGPDSHLLRFDDFERVRDSRYAGAVTLADPGTYTITLLRATDMNGNTAQLDRESTLQVRTEAPVIGAELDRNDSDGLDVAFSVNRTDPQVETYRWHFGDGTNTTGEQVRHEYHPGIYRATLEVIDDVGNVRRQHILLEASDSGPTELNATTAWPADPTNEIRNPGPSIPPDTLLTSRGTTAGQPIHFQRGSGNHILTHDAFALDSVTLTTTINTSLGIGLETADRGSDALFDIEAATGTIAIGGIVAQPSVPDHVLTNVSFGFTVDKQSLSQLEVPPENVTLYRGPDWQQLPTQYVEETADGYRYIADSPGMSPFAITADVGLADDETDSGDDQTSEDDSTNGDDTQDDGEDGSDGTDDSTDGEDGDADGEDGSDGTDGQDDSTSDDGTDGDGTETDDSTDDSTDPGAGNETDTGETNETDPDVGNETETGDDNESDEEDEDSDDGGLLPGFIPVGLLTTVFMFVVVPLVIIYTALKAVAFYLGY